MSDLSPPLLSKFGVTTRLGLLPGLLLTVFLDLLSFGMFIPDVQLRSTELGAKGLLLGATLGIYSLAQLITAPYLGRLSDRAGRRRVILISLLLSVLAYALYANASSIWLVLVSRALSGVAAANIGVAFAYVSDVTKPEDRSKGFGMMGAAFSLGFIVGPVLGTVLLGLGGNKPFLLGVVGASLSAINFLYVLFLLPESLKEPAEPQSKEQLSGEPSALRIAFSDPGLARLLVTFFVNNLGWTFLEMTYFRLLASPDSVYHLGNDLARRDGGLILAFVGIVSALSQFLLIPQLSKRFEEVQLVRVSMLFTGLSLALVPFAPLWLPALLVTFVLSLSSSITNPNVSSLVSRLAPKSIQGGIFGVTQSLGAVARLAAPIFANILFDRANYLPYLVGASLIMLAALTVWFMTQPPEIPELAEN